MMSVLRVSSLVENPPIDFIYIISSALSFAKFTMECEQFLGTLIFEKVSTKNAPAFNVAAANQKLFLHLPLNQKENSHYHYCH